MNTVKHRLSEFIKLNKMSTVEFERSIGVSNGYVSSISKSIQPDKLEIISNLYPYLNIEWLIIGKGEMYKECIYAIQDKFNEDQKSGKLNEIITDNIINTLLEKEQTRPRIPLTAAAGSLSGSSISVTLEQCEQFPVIHQLPSYDFTMFIKGDSMAPKYESGDEIACRNIDQSRFIQWGKPHVLDTTQGIIIKRVYEDADKIRCVSYNPNYTDFSVPKEDIYSMSLVVGSVSISEM